MPETEPTAWELMRILRDIREDLREMKKSSITRDEWALSQQSIDRQILEVNKRVDNSMLEHKEIEAEIEAVKKDVKEVREERVADDKERRKDKSTRWFAVVLAGVSVLFALLRDVILGGGI